MTLPRNIQEEAATTEATTPTTTTITTPTTITSSSPPPLCISRAGDLTAPYVFSLSPLPLRSHVQYTFLTMDREGEESYQNIALAIRGTSGRGRGGTQFLHTR